MKPEQLIKGRTVALLFLGALLLPVMAAPPPTGLAPVLSPAGGFAIDGDLLARQPNGGDGDWMVAEGLPGTGGGVIDAGGAPLDPLVSFHFLDPYNDSSGDLIFTGGSKWADDPNTWVWTTGKPSAKTDINNVLLHLAQDVDGHTWVMISADRSSTSGDSYIDFEFLQNPLVRTDDNGFASWGPHGGRTTNDLVLSLAFTDGGDVADFYASRWEADGRGGFDYVDVTSALPAGRVFVALNTTNITVPYSAFGGTQYQANAFAEAAVDMTALLGGFDPCESFGFEAIMVKTKASASDSAGIEDFIEPIAYKLTIGPSADAGPDQARCAEDGGTVFPLDGSAQAGLGSVASVRWEVVTGTATIEEPGSLDTTARVSSASATLRLEVLQANGCVAVDDVVLTAADPPVLMIDGPATLCPDAVAEYSGPPGMDTYRWSVSGNAAVLGASDQQTVTVVSSNACGENFLLTLSASSGVCAVETMMGVLVGDDVPPMLSLPADVTLEVPADTGTEATGTAAATDDCGSVTVSYIDSQTNLCGDARVIYREWTATDTCGNSTSSIQTITVRDTTSPMLILPPDLTLECPADTDTTATGMATATDNGSAPVVTFSDAVTFGCGETRTISRTWTATDACGNLASAVQTINVRDTTPPVLSLPPDLTLECPADTDTTATGVATAIDNCGDSNVTFSDEVSFGCGETRTISRTWTATDACGNLASAVQTITVEDTTSPVLSLPPDLTLECPADTDTTATGVATATDNCGDPNITFSDEISFGCGETRTISRTWTAIDDCGNVASAVQTINVQDTTPPVLSVPPDLTLEVPADTDPGATGVATATDDCSEPGVTYADVVVEGCGASKTITRTWTALDACDNVASAVQTITVQDTTAPVLSLPPDRTLECPADTSTAATGVATATDQSGSPSVTHSDVVTEGACGGSMSIARTWTAIDDCGNAASAVQTINVQDTTPPRLETPRISVQCPDDVPPPYATLADLLSAGGTAADSCDATLQFALVSDSGLVGQCPGTVTRIYRVTDDCGNSADAVQTIRVDDTIAPMITCPGSVTNECGDPMDPAVLGMATGIDNCDPDVLVTYNDVDVPSTYNIKWTASDPDLNTGPYLPTYLKVAPDTLGCRKSVQTTGRGADPLRHAVAYAEPGGQLDALTSLGGAPMALGQIVPFQAIIEVGGGPGPERGTIEFTANWSTHTTSNNRFGYDTNHMVHCAFVDYADPGSLDPHYNARVVAHSAVVIHQGTSEEQIQGTFRISGLDAGDRVIVEIWMVLSSELPGKLGGTISSELVSAEKAASPPEPITIGNQTVSIGNLAKIVNLPSRDPQPPPPGLPPQPEVPPGMTVRVIDRTWSAVDDCGNRDTCVQRITVRDTLPPDFVEPTNQVQTVEAGWSPNPPLATDGCGDVVVRLYSVETNVTETGSQVVTYVWEAVDSAGNVTRMGYEVTFPPVVLAAPALAIALEQGQVLVTWPGQYTGWSLESSSTMAPPNWAPVTTTPLLTNGLYRVAVEPQGSCCLFRLVQTEP